MTDPLRHLLDAAVEGDNRALGELVRRTQPVLWRLCAALGGGADVEDIVQDTYMRAVRAMPDYRGDAPVLPWLLAIGRRACADHVRRQQRHRRLLDRLHMNATEDHDTGITGSMSADDLVSRIAPERRDAFVLTQLVGLSYDEAADCLGCPVGTIRSRVARARTDLAALVRQAEAN